MGYTYGIDANWWFYTETFIKPIFTNLPSILLRPRDRWKIEWAWIKERLMGWGR